MHRLLNLRIKFINFSVHIISPHRFIFPAETSSSKAELFRWYAWFGQAERSSVSGQAGTAILLQAKPWANSDY